MTRTHELKTDPKSFEALWTGKKRFEIRLNDRDYQPGDELFLRETKFSAEEMKAGSPLIFTGRVVSAKAAYILYGPAYGLLADGTCCMSLEWMNQFQR